MKPKLLFCLYLLLVLSLIMPACKKQASFMNDAVITGFDSRLCPCCGGLMINFIGETQPYKGEFYLITNDPSELGIANNSVFPIRMKVDWTQNGVGCASGAIGNLIKITRFKRQ
jgi:hypothetical protein